MKEMNLEVTEEKLPDTSDKIARYRIEDKIQGFRNIEVEILMTLWR